MSNKISAVITAGGKATRFGSDKMTVLIQGKPLLSHTLECFLSSKKITEIIVLIQKEKISLYKKFVLELNDKKVKIVEAKDERIISLYYGIKKAKGEYVITHDGNRCLTPTDLIDKLIDETIKYEAAMTAVLPTATIKYSENGFVEKTYPRSHTWIAQTPQGFKKDLILRALERALENKEFISTDDSEFITKIGKKVKIVPGDEINIKITYPQDLMLAEQLLSPKTQKTMKRIGLGQDSHAFEDVKSKPLILGGVRISKTGGLKANSDGDVILHSICNALSSAVGGDSLGTWADEMCFKHGIKDSKKYLDFIFQKIKKLNYKISNLSISVEAKKPRLSLLMIKKLKLKLANLLETEIDNIGITFTSGDDLTAFGQGKAIQVFTIVNFI